jgi:molybdopterin-guanine dinucleotide biosynthesis protein A
MQNGTGHQDRVPLKGRFQERCFVGMFASSQESADTKRRRSIIARIALGAQLYPLPPPMGSERMSRQSQPRRDEIAGFVLAGGQSRRFGSDKAIAQAPGTTATFLERAVTALQAVTAQVYVVAPLNRPYLLPGVTQVDDEFPGEGPLGAVISALRAADMTRCLIMAVDLVWIDTDHLSILAEQASDSHPVVFDNGQGGILPLPVALPTASATVLAAEFARGERSLIRALLAAGAISLSPARPALLADVDAPADLTD